MQKGIFTRLIQLYTDNKGEKIAVIFRLFCPEYITSLFIFVLPLWVDAYFISHLKSTSTYAALGVTNNFIHLLFKLAEACSIGMVVLVGHYNGRKQFDRAGEVVNDSFWVTLLLGGLVGLSLYLGAPGIFWWLGVPDDIARQGIPFLRLRAVGVFLTFVYLSFIGFFRGIKNTRTPMYIFIIGSLVFLISDYALIFGHLGFSMMGLKGSALASVLQAGSMALAGLCFLFGCPRYRPYGINLIGHVLNPGNIVQFLKLIWPIALDKATLAAAYIWLSKMLAPLGTCSLASFSVIKDMERFAFLPAIAFAQVITILASNDYGIGNWTGIRANTKKIILIACVLVGGCLVVLSLLAPLILTLFDKSGDFSAVTIRIFPILSVLVFFDLLQLILSGALRGANNVKVVMYTRLVVCLGYFAPVSYLLSRQDIADCSLKFLLIYGSFYIGNALMSIVYIKRLRGQAWKNVTV